MFTDKQHIQDMQIELEAVIQAGVQNIIILLKNAENITSHNVHDNQEDFEVLKKAQRARSRPQSIYPEESATNMRNKKSVSNHVLPSKYASVKRVTKGGLNKDSQLRVTEQLVMRGVITKDMLEQIKKELKHEMLDDSKDKET